MTSPDKWWLWMQNSGFGGSAPFLTLEIYRVIALKDSEFKQMFGTCIGAFHHWQDGASTKYFREKDLKIFDGNFLNKIEQQPFIVQDWHDETKRRGDALIASADRIGSESLEHLINQQLLGLFKDTVDKYWRLGVHSAIPLFGGRALQNILEPYLLGAINSRGENPDNYGMFFTALTRGSYISVTKREEDDLRKLAGNIKQERLDLDNLPPEYQIKLQNHSRNYEWVPYKWIGPVWTEDDFKQRLEKMVAEEEKPKSRMASAQEVIDKLKIDELHAWYFNVLATLGDLKEMKGNAMSRGAYQLGKFRQEIQRRYGLMERHTALMCSWDYLELLNGGKIDLDSILERQKSFLWVVEDGIETLLTGKEALERAASEFAWKEAVKAKQVYEGTPVFPGRVAGLARKILRYEQDRGKFQKGDVLIAYRTTTHYVPLIDISSAIITTEGGVTQHAAQIAREYEIPCLIGVADIIEGVEDGQPLLVDADKGRVEKITQEAYGNMKKQELNKPKANFYVTTRDPISVAGPDIIWLEEASHKEPDRMLIGNKAANQAIIYRMVNVPNGFVVTTAMFHKFILETGLADKLRGLLNKIAKPEPDIGELERISREYTEFIMNADIKGFFDKVKQAYKVLGVESTIARSSSTYEDPKTKEKYKGSSFAGIFESPPNLRNIDEVIDGIKKCWASLYSPGALFYTAKSGFDPLSNKMAGLIQEMKNGVVSGITFAGVDGYTVMEACEGLCEPLAQGRITPTLYILNEDLDAVYIKQGNQKIAAFIDDAGICRERYVQNQLPLRRQDIFELGMIGKKIQKYFGAPQDIEWTITDLVYTTQNRDLTNKPQLPIEVRI